MDGIKITARNLFYLLLQALKEANDNYREDHVLFCYLTSSPRLIRYQGNLVEVLLFPEANFQPKVIGIIVDILEQLNASRLSMPDSSTKRLHFRLHQKNSILFGVKPKKGAVTNAVTNYTG